MSLWDELPEGLLRKERRGWSRLDYDVRRLIVELARNQRYKCAHCSENRNLIIEHDHYPEHGPGDKCTIYNIRGLVCGPCNWHIGMHEAEERGEYPNWPDRFPRVSEREYESYIYRYECRVHPLLEAMRERRMGSLNYWRSKTFLAKFDSWKEWGGKYPWHWGFEEIKDKKYGRIRTPKQFLGALYACSQYVLEQLRKDPDYEPPEAFLKVMVRIKPLLDSIRPSVEARDTSTHALVTAGQTDDPEVISPPV